MQLPQAPLHLSDHDTAQMLRLQTTTASIYHVYKRDNSLDNTRKFREYFQNLSWADIYMESYANTAFSAFHELICLFYSLCFPKVRIKINLNIKIKQT